MHTFFSSSLSDEYQVFEIVLPRPCCVGHVDVKFSLSSSAKNNKLDIVVSLLRPKHSSSQRISKHAGDVLCGPVPLQVGFDVTKRQGWLTLTSPELVKSRSHTLLLVLYNNSLGTCSSSAGTDESLPSSSKDKTESDQDNSDVNGFSCLEDVTVTVRKCKNSNETNSIRQRVLLLEDVQFHEKLVFLAAGVFEESVNNEDRNQLQKLALDMLSWIMGMTVYQTHRYVFNLAYM